jgi:serine protease Do
MVLRGGLISIDRVGSRVSGLGWVIVAAGLGASAIAGAGCWGRSAPTPAAATTAPAAAPLPPLPPSVRSTPPSPPASGVTPKVQPSREALALSDAFANAAAAIRPSVVRLDVEGLGDPSSVAESGEHPPDKPDFLHRLLGRGQAPKHRVPIHGTGSGILLDGKGDILTNSHVVAGADKVTIKLSDQRSFIGRVIGTDPLTDVGVVKFEKAPAGLVAARLGDSDKLRIGQWIIAVGSPLGMAQTVTAGIVSGVGETGSDFRFISGERVRKYIQTDAEINPGNSGGPLVSLEGEVLGLNTLINVGPGGSYGFAIPINQVSRVAATLIKEGRVRYPYIGVSVVAVADIPDALREQLGQGLPQAGAIVASVAPGGPADAAGLKPGDIVTKVAGRPIKRSGDLVADISDQAIGGDVVVDYTRGANSGSLHVKVGEYPVEPASGEGRIGVALQSLTQPLAKSLGLDPRTKGAVVIEVTPGSPAEQSGLVVGDVIRQIDRRPVTNADDAVAAIRSGKGARLLRVVSAAGTRLVTVAPR